MWSGARTEQRMQLVHEANLKEAEKAGMTLDEWHNMMSEKGKSTKPEVPQQTEQTQIYNSADYVLSYLFPQNTARKRNKRR